MVAYTLVSTSHLPLCDAENTAKNMKKEANLLDKRKNSRGEVREGKFQNLRLCLGVRNIRSDGLPTSLSTVDTYLWN